MASPLSPRRPHWLLHLLAALFLAALVLPNSLQALPGDVNGDGVVDELDVQLAQDHLLGLETLDTAARTAADINKNHQVDVGDLMALTRLGEGGLVVVPSFHNLTRFQAETLIDESGLTLGEIRHLRADGPANRVIGQLPPRHALAPLGSAVDLYFPTTGEEGARLEITPSEIDLGASATTAVFTLRTIGGDFPWRISETAHTFTTPQTGRGDATLTVTLDRASLLQTEGSSLGVAVLADLGGTSGSALAIIHYRQDTHPAPRLESILSRQPSCPGDTIRIMGSFLAANPADNQISIGGRLLVASSLDWQPPQLIFQIPPDLPAGVVEIRARRLADATWGDSPWSRPYVVRLAEPTEIHLVAPPEGTTLWVTRPYTSISESWGKHSLEDIPTFAPDWEVGGRNLSLVNGVLINPVFDISRWGTFDESRPLAIEARFGESSYYIPAWALGDDKVIARPHAMHFDKEEFHAQLTPGRTFQVRLLASERETIQVRTSNWINVTVTSNPAPAGSVAPVSAWSLLAGEEPWQVAVGTTLLIRGSGSENESTLRAPGLWAGDAHFPRTMVHSPEPGFEYKAVPLMRTGSHTIENLTNGNIFRFDVVRGETAADHRKPTLQTAVKWVVVDPNRDLRLFMNGVRLHISAGALPVDPLYANVVNLDYRVDVFNPHYLDDPEADDGQALINFNFERFALADEVSPFEWEPATLLGPITVAAYYTPGQAINGPPSIGALDPSSGIYWPLPCTFDTANRTVRLELPAGTYEDATKDAASKATSAPPPGFPPVSLHRITKKAGVPYLRSERSIMTDENNYFAVHYISDPSSSSYVSEAYAAGILDTMISAHGNLRGRGWQEPAGTTTVYLRRTILGGYGSTTKGVFGQPTITINIAECPQGSKAYYTTAAHEVGHAFQRSYTTNIVAKWFDEAAAEWVALDTVGENRFLNDLLNEQLPFIHTLPATFTFGFSMDQGYAAVPWTSWLEQNHPNSIRRVYEALSGNPWAWEDHRGTVANATNRTINELYGQFARDYWLQNFSPMSLIDLTLAAGNHGHQVSLQLTESGTLTFSSNRPTLSSIRYSVQPTQQCLDTFAGRDAVLRVGGTADSLNAFVHLYGDQASGNFAPNNPTHLITLEQPTETHHLIDDIARHRTYRVILVNAAAYHPFNPTVRFVFPTIHSLQPSSGSRAGGYTVRVNGMGFGPEEGQILISGAPVAITEWTDTLIRFTMPPVGDHTSSRHLTVRTVEQAATNSRLFTFN